LLREAYKDQFHDLGVDVRISACILRGMKDVN
jgi:hypothetical protein